MTAFPDWLHWLSIASLALAGCSALAIVADEIRNPQKMWIMNLVWPLAALFGSVLWLALYLHDGRRPRSSGTVPMALSVAKGASHCGAGCTLGDIIAEWSAFAFPAIAVALGWGSLFAQKTFAVWILDYAVAFAIGIAFQYFTIAPMRHLSLGDGIVQAVKADTASITSWQVGMYGAMAVCQFLWLAPAYGHIAAVDTPEFWLVMQIAMLFGFITAFPVNWLLIRSGVKERM